jgi:hypothetical protein
MLSLILGEQTITKPVTFFLLHVFISGDTAIIAIIIISLLSDEVSLKSD